ncbi:peptidoglycan DD-metalloendopeptidase family protein [Rossellomorea sp. AcN35-11]|nr:peptidoglycan DD-metalloendopeptidase family protein [Rossellomorea aquimaris]WJV28174.1 peptidoglycan DD-metalloendopeptidase family protein [Rossellomorea sp. AcN35-11]
MVFDYMRRLLIVFLLALCMSIIFFTGKIAKAETSIIAEDTASWIFPVEGVITDSYGTRSGTHKGMDIGGDIGSPVYSVAKGTVIKSYFSPSYGHVVFVRHDNGYETVYAHLKDRLVEENQEVGQGAQLGSLGNTGRSTGAHLHFEVHKGEWTIDKENAVDPYMVYGKGEVGQLVFAQEKDPYQALDVSSSPKVNLTRGDHSHGNTVNHSVHKGETLWSISRQYHITVEDIMIANDLKDTNLMVNQSLKIPGADRTGYVVKTGDTLYSISVSTGIDLDVLVALNGLDLKSPIYPQQVLLIR